MYTIFISIDYNEYIEHNDDGFHVNSSIHNVKCLFKLTAAVVVCEVMNRLNLKI